MQRKRTDRHITSSGRVEEAQKRCCHGRWKLEIRGAALTETGAPQTKVVNDYFCYFFLCCVQTPGRKKLNGGKDYFGSQLKSLSWQGRDGSSMSMIWLVTLHLQSRSREK